MRWDSYSGDYGPNFFGVAVNSATYIIDHPEFGWLAFGGNVRTDGNQVRIEPRDAFRQRVYVAPLGLWLTLDSGTFDSIEIQTKTHAVRATLSAATPVASNARLRIEQPARVSAAGSYHPKDRLTKERGSFTIPLQNKPVVIELLADR
jgi:hypothetical protein